MVVADRSWKAWVAATAAVLVAGIAIQAQNPPRPLPAHAASHLFAAGRAQKHVEAIARAPHPMGSEESQQVRQRLIKRLEEIGLTAEIQSPNRQNPFMPQNVLARMRGQGPSGEKALMLCAHYDSVPEGPGASDNAAGVAVVLETLRALKAGPPLERDVIALFPDGEESGLHGSRLFVDEHPWAKDVAVVLNFDARGNSGPSIMFETSDANGWLIRQLAQAVPQPLATSLSMDVYKILPNDTDLSVFKRAGMGGLNFAFGAGLAYYHTPEDTPENLDQSTLQHQGENALATARHLGGLDLNDTKEEDVIYTSILSRIVLSHPKSWIVPLALLALAIFLALVINSVGSGEFGYAHLASGALVIFLGIAVSLLAIGALFLLAICWSSLREASGAAPILWFKYDVTIMTACALLTALVTAAITSILASRRPARALILGAFSWWLALSLATAFWLPGASYLFVWPTLGGLLGMCVSTRFSPGSLIGWVATFFGSMPALLLVSPLIRTTFDGLSLGMTAPIMVLVALYTGALMPLWGPLFLPLTEQPRRPAREHSPPLLELQVEHAS
jgi:hypothetical protein